MSPKVSKKLNKNIVAGFEDIFKFACLCVLIIGMELMICCMYFVYCCRFLWFVSVCNGLGPKLCAKFSYYFIFSYHML